MGYRYTVAELEFNRSFHYRRLPVSCVQRYKCQECGAHRATEGHAGNKRTDQMSEKKESKGNVPRPVREVVRGSVPADSPKRPSGTGKPLSGGVPQESPRPFKGKLK